MSNRDKIAEIRELMAQINHKVSLIIPYIMYIHNLNIDITFEAIARGIDSVSR